MSNKKINIVFPCFNQPTLLSQSLFFLTQTTEKKLQITIKDDCSSLDYQEVIKKYQHLNINYIRNEQNLGAIQNMISCLFIDGQDEYIMCHHEDDLIHKSYIKIAINYLNKNPDVSFIASDALVFKDLNKINNNDVDKFNVNKYNYLQISKFFAHKNNISFGSIIYRKKYLSKQQINLKKYAMLFDRPFLINILKNSATKAAIINEKLYFYRHHSFPDNRWRGLTIEHLFNLYKKYKDTNHDCRVIAKYFFSYCELENKKYTDFIFFMKSLFKLKILFKLPTISSIKYICGGLIILTLGKKNYMRLFEYIKF